MWWRVGQGAQLRAHLAYVIIFLNTEGLEVVIPTEGFSLPDLRHWVPLRFAPEAHNHFLTPETSQRDGLAYKTFSLLNLEKVESY